MVCQWGCLFTSLPSMFEGSIHFTLLTIGFVSPFYFSLSGGCEVLTHRRVFHMPIVPLYIYAYIYFTEVSVKVFYWWPLGVVYISGYNSFVKCMYCEYMYLPYNMYMNSQRIFLYIYVNEFIHTCLYTCIYIYIHNMFIWQRIVSGCRENSETSAINEE